MADPDDSLARGNVTVLPKHWGRTYTLDWMPDYCPPGPSKDIAIRFVWVGPGWIHGELEPFRDPNRGTVFKTFFEGELSDDVFFGTCVVMSSPIDVASTAHWAVKRRQQEL